jgi:hypothetical protein
MVKRNIHPDVISRETFELRLDQSAIFEVDRSNLVLQLRTLRSAIEEGAEEMDMVAIERVFGDSLSRAIVHAAGRLDVTARLLAKLILRIERAQVPRAQRRHQPMYVLRRRRKSKN